MTIKTELQSLLDQVASLKGHVRDTGEVAFYAALHQAEMVLAMADEALSPPKVPTAAMQQAGEIAAANLPEGTTPADSVAAILTAALGAA